MIWRAFARQGGVNIKRIVHTIKGEDANKGVASAEHTLKFYLDTHKTLEGTICCGIRCPGYDFGYTSMYFGIKILYIVNTLCQFFLLNAFLSFNFTGYGPEGFDKLLSGENWIDSPRFPRVTMCDFMIRHLGSNQHWYAIQCNLPINMYNEKIFLGIWMWLLILTVLNILSIIPWIISLSRPYRISVIKRYLKTRVPPSEVIEESSLLTTTSKRHSQIEIKYFKEFIDYLDVDGFLIFQIIANNTDEITAGKIIENLYRNYEPSSPYPMSDV